MIKLGDQVGQNSLKASVADIATSGKATGWRASEHSQTKLHEVGYHKYPSGKEAMKAINDNGVIFSDKNGIFSHKKTVRPGQSPCCGHYMENPKESQERSTNQNDS